MHKYLLKGDPLKVYRTTAGDHSRVLGTSEEFKVVDLSDYEELKEKAQALVEALKEIKAHQSTTFYNNGLMESQIMAQEALDKWEEE